MTFTPGTAGASTQEAPVLNSISPNPMTISESNSQNQQFTITGNNLLGIYYFVCNYVTGGGAFFMHNESGANTNNTSFTSQYYGYNLPTPYYPKTYKIIGYSLSSMPPMSPTPPTPPTSPTLFPLLPPFLEFTIQS